MIPAQRRKEYRPRIFSPDYFVVRHILAFTERQVDLRVRAGSPVLDVGCGEQPFRGRIEARGGTYLGCDISQTAGKSVGVICTVTRLPFADRSFDVVLCSEVLEHVEDPDGAFGEMLRVLKEDGHLIVTTPFLYPLHEEPNDFVRLTPHKLVSMARENGVETVEAVRAGNGAEVLATAWDNLWNRERESGVLRRAISALLRSAGNGLAVLAGFLPGRGAPARSFLGSLFVFRKPPG
jgi:SAM-dependent methyltransferase